jgi:hypothetical protein
MSVGPGAHPEMDGDPMAVVDAELKVRELLGERVVDAHDYADRFRQRQRGDDHDRANVPPTLCD